MRVKSSTKSQNIFIYGYISWLDWEKNMKYKVSGIK